MFGSPRLWLTAAAVALAVLISALFAVRALVHERPGPPARAATASPSPAPSALLSAAPLAGPIPAGQPVVLYRRAAGPEGTLYGATWDGAVHVGPSAPVVGPDVQSPDGSKVLFGIVVYDVASGAQTRLPVVGGATPSWGDDSRHVCLVTPSASGTTADISIDLPGATPKLLAQLGVIAVEFNFGRATPVVLACSALSDRVVVVQRGLNGETQELWAVRISTGVIEYHLTYPLVGKTQGDGVRVDAASHDGQYVSETDSATGDTTIRHLPDGAIAGQLSGREVQAFSWSEDRVLATRRQANLAPINSSAQDPQLVDWISGRSVWTAPAGAHLDGVAARPEGGDVALALNICPTPAGCRDDLWIVSGAGRARQVDLNIHLLR